MIYALVGNNLNFALGAGAARKVIFGCFAGNDT